MTSGMAADLLGEIFKQKESWKFEQPSGKQRGALKRYGLWRDGMLAGEAHRLLKKHHAG